MNQEQVLRFLREHHRSVLATYRRDGTVQMSPVVAAVNAAGLVVISTRERAIKTINLRRDPRAALVAFTDRFFGPWGMLWGEAEVVSLPTALPLLEDYYRRVVGEHPDWDEYGQAMNREQRVLLQIRITETGPRKVG